MTGTTFSLEVLAGKHICGVVWYGYSRGSEAPSSTSSTFDGVHSCSSCYHYCVNIVTKGTGFDLPISKNLSLAVPVSWLGFSSKSNRHYFTISFDGVHNVLQTTDPIPWWSSVAYILVAAQLVWVAQSNDVVENHTRSRF